VPNLDLPAGSMVFSRQHRGGPCLGVVLWGVQPSTLSSFLPRQMRLRPCTWIMSVNERTTVTYPIRPDHSS
jgi:hypothetical protein